MRRWLSFPFLAVAGLALGLALFTGASSASGQATPRNVAPPTIAGAAQEGSVLKADHGRWNTADVSFAYQWRRCLPNGTACADLANATDRIYTPRAEDLGHSLRLVVAATTRNRAHTGVAVSDPTAAIAALPPQAPHDALPPTISGTAAAGQTLTANPGTWTGSGLAFSYRWRRCNATGGDCGDTSVRTQTYRLSGGDTGRRVRVVVTAANSAGAGSSLSDPSALVAGPTTPVPAKPQNTSAPAVSGSVQVGQTLHGSVGSWASNPTAWAFFWLRCDTAGRSCNVIAGARQTTYAPTSADAGHTIRFEVQARNAAGTTVALSAQTAVVAAAPPKAAPPANTSLPKISGTAQEGKTLAGDRGTWSNSPTSYEYTWRRCDSSGHACGGIGGAHSTSYTLTAADIGRTIRFQVAAKNTDGAAEATSAPTASVRASAPPGNTADPTIAGTPQEGKTLTVNRGNWTHNPSAFAYSWLRCDRNGGSCAAIGGATGTSYTLTSADVGNTVRSRVAATNSEGTSTATSDPTAVIQKAAAPPPPPRGNGCPAGGNPDQVANIQGPANLIIDQFVPSPSIVTRGTATWTLKVHVTSTCGGPVQGALVYGTATPFNQWTIPAEQATGPDGYATLTFQRMSGFPVSSHQQLIAMFLRARKPGENVLAGITGYRLVSVPVSLH